MGERKYFPGSVSNRPGTLVMSGTVTLDAVGDVVVADFPGMVTPVGSIRIGAGTYSFAMQDDFINLIRINVFIRKNVDPGIRYYLASGTGVDPVVVQFANLSSPAAAVNPTSCELYLEFEYDYKSTT